MFLSAAIDSGIGLTAGKMLVGKSIAINDETYLTTVRLREKFPQLKKFLTIKPSAESEEHEKVEELKGIVVKLQEELNRQRTVTQTVTEENLKIKRELHTLNDILSPLQPMLEFASTFESPRAMLEFLRAIKERSDTARQRAEPMSPLAKKAKEVLSGALSEVLERDSEKLRRILSREINIENDVILRRAIQAAKDSIKEDYGIEI